jgi:hypothetical protein
MPRKPRNPNYGLRAPAGYKTKYKSSLERMRKQPGDDEIVEPTVVPDGYEPIPGWDKYVINKQGQIYRLKEPKTKYNVRRKREPRGGHHMVNRETAKGTLAVTLNRMVDGKLVRRELRVAQLVWLVFKGEELPVHWIRYKDGNGFNAALSNLIKVVPKNYERQQATKAEQ